MMKIVLNFMQNNGRQMNSLAEKRILVDTLCLHLDVMTRNMGMQNDVLILEKLLVQDWERVSNLELSIDTSHMVCYNQAK